MTARAAVPIMQYNGLVCRGGIYAARCNRLDITNYRVNRTGEQCSPLQAKNKFVLTAHLPEASKNPALRIFRRAGFVMHSVR